MSRSDPSRRRAGAGESTNAHLLLAAARGVMEALRPDLEAGLLPPAKHVPLLHLDTALERFPLAAPADRRPAA